MNVLGWKSPCEHFDQSTLGKTVNGIGWLIPQKSPGYLCIWICFLDCSLDAGTDSLLISKGWCKLLIINLNLVVKSEFFSKLNWSIIFKHTKKYTYILSKKKKKHSLYLKHVFKIIYSRDPKKWLLYVIFSNITKFHQVSFI